MKRSHLALVATLLACGTAAAQAPPSEPKATVERLAPDLHILYGAGGGQVAGNVLVLTGKGGTLLVDTGYPIFVPKYREAIASFGGGPVAYVVNTHFHDDHSEGNKQFGAAGALIVAHDNVRQMLMHDNKINVVRTVLDQPAFPAAALPVVTYGDRIELYFDGERLELLHVAPAHTAGDTVVFLREHNVVHTGDVFLSSAYPFADVDNGGDFDGLIEFCARVLTEIDRDTVLVPGHGKIAHYDDLAAYVDMLKAVRERVAALIAEGATLEQVLAAAPTAEWDAKYGNPKTFFLDRVYKSLEQVPGKAAGVR
jgi:cyclase